ncbi:MAG TPA: MFS transporter [Kofleriaceae bacterium]
MARGYLRIGRALRHRNFQLYFVGQGTSLVGTWLTKFATAYMAYRLTGSTLMLGLVAFASNAPSSILAPFAGVIVDRSSRQRVILITQIAAGLQSAALAVFALTGIMNVWHLMWLGAVQGVINAFDMPARQSFVRELIEDKGDLSNAIALNSSLVNVAKMGGPAIAAALVALVGEGWCFTIDALSYLAVIGSLLAIKVTNPIPPNKRADVKEQLMAGLRYVQADPVIKSVLLLLTVTSLLGGAYLQMLPAVAAEEVGHSPSTLGILMASGGLGALTGALYLASREDTKGLATLIMRVTASLGVGLVLLLVASTTWTAVPVLFIVGFSLMIQMAATNTIIQTMVEPTMLGRVIALYLMVWTGGMPLGAFLQGLIAERFGAVHTLAAGGALVLVAAVVFRAKLPAIRAARRAWRERTSETPDMAAAT